MPHFKITSVEKEREEVNHGLCNSRLPSLVSSSPINKENHKVQSLGDKIQPVLGFSLQPQEFFSFQEDCGALQCFLRFHGVRTMETWQHEEHGPCYFNLCHEKDWEAVRSSWSRGLHWLSRRLSLRHFSGTLCLITGRERSQSSRKIHVRVQGCCRQKESWNL